MPTQTTLTTSADMTTTIDPLAAGSQCGGNGNRCAMFGPANCMDAPFSGRVCQAGLTCTRIDMTLWTVRVRVCATGALFTECVLAGDELV